MALTQAEKSRAHAQRMKDSGKVRINAYVSQEAVDSLAVIADYYGTNKREALEKLLISFAGKVKDRKG